MKYIFNPSTDPPYNLAFEEHFLTREHGDYAMLWRNSPTVVIGCNQCAEAELDLGFIRARKIGLVRRITGGGAVYHDLGNLNFTFITDYREGRLPDYRAFCGPVLGYLSSLGLDARANGRNDMTVNGMKFSGTAQAVRGGRLLFHGTLLFDADLTVLSRALTPCAEKLESKGIKSVRSRVTNLSPLLPGMTCEAFRAGLGGFFTAAGSEPFEPEKTVLDEIRALSDEKYRDPKWTFGKNPACSRSRTARFPGGTLTVSFDTGRGKLTGIAFTGDFFGERPAAELENKLRGTDYTPEAIASALGEAGPGKYISGLDTAGLLELLF